MLCEAIQTTTLVLCTYAAAAAESDARVASAYRAGSTTGLWAPHVALFNPLVQADADNWGIIDRALAQTGGDATVNTRFEFAHCCLVGNDADDCRVIELHSVGVTGGLPHRLHYDR